MTKRRSTLVGLFLTFVVCSTFSPASARTTRPASEWFVFDMAGANGLSVDIAGHPSGHGPAVVAFTWADHLRDSIGDSYFDGAWLYKVGSEGTSLRAATPAGHVGAKVISDLGSRFEIQFGSGQGSAWHSTIVVFFPNIVLDKMTVRSTSSAGLVSQHGTGARALDVSDLKDAGLRVGAVAGGVGTYDLRPKTGIVGAMDNTCSACWGTWSAPGHRTGRWESTTAQAYYGLSEGRWTMAGPAGPWSFEWAGATTVDPFSTLASPKAATSNAPIVAAWAPVGAAWKAFDHAFPFHGFYPEVAPQLGIPDIWPLPH